jgi:hypothetical protein
MPIVLQNKRSKMYREAVLLPGLKKLFVGVGDMISSELTAAQVAEQYDWIDVCPKERSALIEAGFFPPPNQL